MTTFVETIDPPALRRLASLERTWVAPPRPAQRSSAPRPMGHQPGLDGLRAISVLAVMLYHAGFGWMSGGFFGVEVFFVVSGYLITSLLLDEREKDQRVSLERFWIRRARRLFPALATMLVAVATWVALLGSDEQRSTLGRDLPWSIFYVGNWGQITGSRPYFSATDPPLLRHLWSLAVEEQWYIVWPLVFVALMSIGTGHLRSRGVACISAAAILMFATSIAHGSVSDNALYLSTVTRASGLLLGAGCAFVWRPWRAWSPSAMRGRRLDPVGVAALTLLVCVMCVAVLTSASVTLYLLALVSILSMAVVAVVVYPTATGMRTLLGWKPLVAIGRRSYGLYLWHWPIFVIGHVDHSANWTRFVLAMVVTAAISEACYHYIETPVRRGWIGERLRRQRNATGSKRLRLVRTSRRVGAGSLAAVVGLFAFYASVDHHDPAAGGGVATFDPASASAAAASGASAARVGGAPPRRVVLVGDSQAHSLAINLPRGIGDTFTISDGSVEGCGVYDSGTVVSARSGFRRSFGDCTGWAARWGRSAARAEAQVAVVVIGAWEVFDLETGGGTLAFGSADADAFFLSHLAGGIDALTGAGAQVALLEVPCMRPIDVKGSGIPALPERGDDTRTAHLNTLLRRAAAADPQHVTFVPGPPQWCGDPALSTDVAFRWDGVHVYRPGANLIYETIAQPLLSIPLPPA